MTTEQEIKTLTKVCRLMAKHAMAGTGHEASEVTQLLDTIDVADDEPERKACAHTVLYLGQWIPWWIYRCEKCGAIGRRPSEEYNSTNIEWWPEGGAK